MNTPTPDDLSARQLKVAVDAMHVCYMDHADVSVTTTLLEEMAKAAIAALSAGGLRCTDPDNCRRCSEDASTPHAGIPRDSSARTTPPPEITK